MEVNGMASSFHRRICCLIIIFITVAIVLTDLLFVPSAGAQTEETAMTTAAITVGTSNIYNDDVASARTHAISNSLVAAISQIISNLLPYDIITADFHVLNTILYTRTKEFIQDYKVLNSSRYGKQYSVIVEATVLTGAVEEQLSGVGLRATKNTMPGILFFVTEQDLSDPQIKYWWKNNPEYTAFYTENMMSIVMQDKGFPIMDHNEFTLDPVMRTVLERPDLNKEEVITLGAHFKADVVVMGKASAQKTANTMGTDTGSYKGVVTARAFRTDTGAQIGSTLQSSVAVDADPASGAADALSAAGRLAGNDLADQISAAWMEKQKALSGIDLYVKWDGDLPSLVKFRKALAGLPGVTALVPREMTAIDAVIGVDYEGDEKELADALIAHTFSSFGINIYEISDHHLSIAIVPI